MSYVRAVRFTDVSRERVEELRARVEAEGGGPPEGVNATGLQVLLDEEQGTALVLQHFASEQDMKEGEAVFAAMDPSDTPGTRASVDRCTRAGEMKA